MNEEVLMIVDRPIKRGIELGLYPSWKSAIDRGSLLVLADDEWQQQTGLRIDGNPRGVNDIYVFNPYSNTYLRAVDNANLMDEFYREKCFVVKEAFVRLGAKHIVINNKIVNIDTLLATFGIDAAVSNNKGSLKTTFNKLNSNELKLYIESKDENRKAGKVEDVRNFLYSKGLIKDVPLQLLCERLELDGCLCGEESYMLTFYEEIEEALNVLSTLDCSAINASLDFSRKHNRVRKISKEIIVRF